MSALARIADLPDWPARMTAPVAAAYMGLSTNTFTERYAAISRREGGKVFWARIQLDRIVAEQFDIATAAETPAAAPPESLYERYKAGLLGA